MAKIRILPYKQRPLSEIRPAYFLKAFGEDVLDMRIFSFGKCNYSCPYCKRNGYDKDDSIINGSMEISEEYFYKALDDAIQKRQVVRLSGGDPICYPDFSLKVLKYVKNHGGITSIAHNGSGTEFVKRVIPYLDFASIDLKASSYKSLQLIAGINENMAKSCFENTIRTIQLLRKSNVYTDIRTCIFSDTSFNELCNIAELIQGDGKCENMFWTLRTYSPVDSFNKMPLTSIEMSELALKLSQKYPKLKIGVRNKWTPEGFIYFLNGHVVECFITKNKKLSFKENKELALV